MRIDSKTYIEDCEVCCKPIEISFTIEDDELASFYAKTLAWVRCEKIATVVCSVGAGAGGKPGSG
jgi:hypothetical protein